MRMHALFLQPVSLFRSWMTLSGEVPGSPSQLGVTPTSPDLRYYLAAFVCRSLGCTVSLFLIYGCLAVRPLEVIGTFPRRAGAQSDRGRIDTCSETMRTTWKCASRRRLPARSRVLHRLLTRPRFFHCLLSFVIDHDGHLVLACDMFSGKSRGLRDSSLWHPRGCAFRDIPENAQVVACGAPLWWRLCFLRSATSF